LIHGKNGNVARSPKATVVVETLQVLERLGVSVGFRNYALNEIWARKVKAILRDRWLVRK